MAEFIRWKEKTLGILLRGYEAPEKTQFLTANEEPLQCGIGVFKKGAAVEPHQHISHPATIEEFQEFILIQRGKAMAQVLSPEGDVVCKIEMRPGDALLLLRGGHAFDFLEDTQLLEVKQGPYLGREKMKSVFPQPR